jgi:hypothetical protein
MHSMCLAESVVRMATAKSERNRPEAAGWLPALTEGVWDHEEGDRLAAGGPGQLEAPR